LDDFKDDNEDDYKIELEYWEGENITPESLVQVEYKDLKDEDKRKKERLIERLSVDNIPLELVKTNRYISIEGQSALINYLRLNILNTDCHFEGQLPSNKNQDAIFSLTYQYLFSENDKKSKSWTERQVVAATKYWVGQKPNIPALINYPIVATESENINTRIRNVFTFTSHFFEFAWPKYLKAFANIYNFVAKEMNEPEINLEYLLMKLEFGSGELHEVALKDAGLPNDIIKKIAPSFEGCESFDQLHIRFNEIQAILSQQLSGFEMTLLEKHL
jgi:hypothetical protein